MIGRILTPGDYQRMPWKNGGGVTTEIYKETSPAGEMNWRVSIADVASDGPFSAFPGIDRWIMVIEGAGMVLTVDGETKRVDRPFDPLFFSGDAETDCTLLNGPIRDFNFMIARGFGKGTLRVLHLERTMVARLREDTCAVHILAGTVALDTYETRDLATGDTWIADEPRKATLTATSQSIVAVLSIDVPNAD